MKPTIIAKKAANWVDRGEPAVPRLAVLLQFFFGLDSEQDRAWLEEQARAIEGMVAADATDRHISGYLRELGRQLGIEESVLPSRRLASVALWSTAKAAQVRDFAERVLQGEVPVNAATPDSLSHWLAERLLDADELAEWERDPARHEPPAS